MFEMAEAKNKIPPSLPNPEPKQTAPQFGIRDTAFFKDKEVWLESADWVWEIAQ